MTRQKRMKLNKQEREYERRLANLIESLDDNKLIEEIKYRQTMQVVQTIVFRKLAFAQCPRCKKTMEREYVSFCDRCGQKLNWTDYTHAEKVIIMPDES